jgi:hypothetical protein
MAPSTAEETTREQMAEDTKTWYWCLRHGHAEPAGQACGSEQRLGPYASAEEAAAFAERAAGRNEAWEEEDRRWDGEED